MFWQLCIGYANGTAEGVKVCQDLEIALNCVDRLYGEDGSHAYGLSSATDLHGVAAS